MVTLPPISRELVAEFDPLSMSTPKLTDTQTKPKLNDTQTISIGESAKIEDFCHLPEHGETKPLELNTDNTSGEVSAHCDLSAVDRAYNSWSESAESGEHGRQDTPNSEGTELYPKPACSTPDAVDDGKCMSCSSGSSSYKGGRGYVEVWACTSSQQRQNAVATGLSPSAAIFFPAERETIKSNGSSSPSLSSPFDDEDLSVFCPPVPKMRSFPRSPTTDQSVNASQPPTTLVPSRAAPSPPYHDSKLKMQTNISERKANKNVLDEGGEMTVISSSLLDMPTTTESDSKLNLLVSRGLPQPLTSDEEQMLTMSFQSSSEEVSPLPVCDVSSRPQPKPRELPRQLAVASDRMCSPPHVQKRLAPLIMPTATQKPPSSTLTTVPLTTVSSPLDRVIAVGGVNVLSMSSRGAATAPLITSSGVSGPLTSPSSRTPPAPPPKYRKPSTFVYSPAVDGDTTDEDLDSADIKDSKF